MPVAIQLEGLTLAGCKVFDRAPVEQHTGAKWRVIHPCGHRGVVLGKDLLDYERVGRQRLCRECSRERRKRENPTRPNPNKTEAERERDRRRDRIKHSARSVVVKCGRMPKYEREAAAQEDHAENRLLPVRRLLKTKPTTRGECQGRARPCPWVSCRHHLYLDVSKNGNIRLNFPDVGPEAIPETCSLDVADRGGGTLEDIGEYMNLTRERVRQLEEILLTRLRRGGSFRES